MPALLVRSMATVDITHDGVGGAGKLDIPFDFSAAEVNYPSSDQRAASRANGNAAPEPANSTTAADYSRIYTGLVSGKTYVFSVWVKPDTATNLDITVNNVTSGATIAGDKQYTAADGLSTSGWKRIDHSFIADSSGQANIMLGVVNNTGQGGSYTQSAGSVNLWVVELNAEATPALPTSQQVTRSTCRACCRDWAWTLPWQPALAHS
jgi:hypothetical protein